MICPLCNKDLSDAAKLLGNAERVKDLHVVSHFSGVLGDAHEVLKEVVTCGDKKLEEKAKKVLRTWEDLKTWVGSSVA